MIDKADFKLYLSKANFQSLKLKNELHLPLSSHHQFS